MAQINDAFGPFDPTGIAAASSPPPGKPHPFVSELSPPTGPRRARGNSHHHHGQYHGIRHQQFNQGQGQGHHHNQPSHTTSSTLATTATVPFSQGQYFDPAALYQQHQQQHPVFGLADQLVQLSISDQHTGGGMGHFDPPFHAGPSNYSNNIEHHVYGPHTFVPMGIVFPNEDDHDHNNHNRKPNTQDNEQELQYHLRHQNSSLVPFPGFPYCGLPIGSGPEGSETHMPEWEECPLRRCKSSFQPGPGGGFRAAPEVLSASEGEEVEASNEVAPEPETNTAGNGNGMGGGHQRSLSCS